MATKGNQPIAVTDCPICLDTSKKPKALSCLHAFCLQCLVKYGHEECKDEPGDELPCPLCRQMFRVPVGGFDKLPTNFFIEHLISTESLKPTSKKANCQTCEAGHSASKFCVQCSQDMCDTCARSHSRMKATKEHTIVTQDEKQDSQVMQKSRINYCEEHEEKLLQLYCIDCNVSFCSKCIAKHNTHKCSELGDVSEEMKSKLKTSDPLLSRSLNECQSELIECNKHKASLLEQTSAAEKSIIDQGNELKRLIDSQCSQLIDELKKSKEKRLKVIETRINDINRQMLIISTYQQYRDELIDKGTACDITESGNELLTGWDQIANSYEVIKIENLNVYEVNFLSKSESMSIEVGIICTSDEARNDTGITLRATFSNFNTLYMISYDISVHHI